MALVIALFVLVVVSILGAVAMRTALFQNRVSINNQVNNLAFQAAESGLDTVHSMLLVQFAKNIKPSNPGSYFYQASNKPMRVCLNADGSIATPDFNAVRSTVDGKTTYTVPCPTLTGSNTSLTTVFAQAPQGNQAAIPNFDVNSASLIVMEVRAYASVPNTNVQTVHAQQWGVIGP